MESTCSTNIGSNNENNQQVPTLLLPPPCTCPYFGDKNDKSPVPKPAEVKIIPSDKLLCPPGKCKIQNLLFDDPYLPQIT